MANHTLTNTDVGPRGFWHQDRVVLVEAGDKVEVSDMTDDEVKAAKASGYFKLDGGPLDHDGDGAKGGSLPGLTGKTKAELLEIAEKEGVTIEDGATVADIRSAIELHREA